MKLINDPVYGLIHIRTPLIFDLIGHPLFQRLRRIKQTGLTHLVYPGAQHTRFHHALGAMHLMGMAIDELRIKHVEISSAEAEAALIAVLLHDIGHSPYSHALEGLIIGIGHEEIGMEIMRYLKENFGSQLEFALQMFTGQYHRPFFHQLISGQLDLDRLDYLSRDSFYTGVAEGVVGHDRLLRMLNVVDDELVVEEKGIYSIEKFLVARRIMYWQVYLHKTVLSAELMSQAAIRMIREMEPEEFSTYLAPELGYFMSQHFDIASFELHRDEALHQFTLLDDISIDYSFKRLQDSRHAALRYLTRNLFNRHLHKIHWQEEPITFEQLEDMVRQCMATYGWAEATSRQLIWTGSESNSVYIPEESEIYIQMKSGEIRPYSTFLPSAGEIRRSEKFYLCHPGI